jgi:ABC-type uncharacterized transport system involved in gliding motility auxiliary subunit
MAAEPTPTLRRRRVWISANVLVQIVAMLALVGMANWLVHRHYLRFDWTRSSYYKIAEKTKQVLGSLKEPVKVIVFLQPNAERESLEKIYQDTRNLLKEFEYFGKNKLEVIYVDPQRDRARAEQLVDEYKVNSPNVVIFACGPRHKYINIEDLVDLDPQQFGQGERIKDYKGEGVFLAAIQTVTEEIPPKVYFLTGHGERDPENFNERDGYSTIANYIKRDNITVQKWNLLEQQKLPTDAGAILVAGPRQPFSEPELALLDDYLKNHGRVLMMLDPREKTGLEEFVQHWGVKVDDDLAEAKVGTLLGTELINVNASCIDYASHPITARLQGVNTSFSYARSIHRFEQMTTLGADQPNVTELVKTPAAFWGETDLESEKTEFDPARDIRGPLCLAVAVEAGKPQGTNVSVVVTRAVVVGSSSFADNSSLSGGNLDFFMNALNWLLQREELIAVSPKFTQEFRLDMSVQQVRAVYALVVIALPLAVAVIGLLVWTRRRK